MIYDRAEAKHIFPGDPQSLQLKALRTVLEHFDWHSEGSPTRQEAVQLWTHKRAGDVPIVLPVRPGLDDAPRLIERAWARLRSEVGDSAEKFARSLVVTSERRMALSEWHKLTTLSAGLIYWIDGERLYRAAREMMVASAKSARAPREHHGSASGQFANAFLRECLMGQSGEGSYIVRAHTPLDLAIPIRQARDGELPLRVDGDSIFGEDVLDVFESGLSASRDCLNEYNSHGQAEVFREAAPHGVSFELLTALANAAENGDAGISVRRGLESGSQYASEFVFRSAEVPALRTASMELAKPDAARPVSVTGDVVVLSRAAEQSEYEIRILALDGRYRKVRVELNAEQYEFAINAHVADAPITVTGIMERRGNYWVISECLDIENAPIDLSVPEGVDGTVGPVDVAAGPTEFAEGGQSDVVQNAIFDIPTDAPDGENGQ